MTHQDHAGNQYRYESGEWQVLRVGLGWTPFNYGVELTDGTIIEPKESQINQPKYTEAEKSLIIAQARDIHLQMVAVEFSAKSDAPADWIAETAVADAKALIEALKKEGVI